MPSFVETSMLRSTDSYGYEHSRGGMPSSSRSCYILYMISYVSSLAIF